MTECGICYDSPEGLHCFRLTKVKGVVGYRGCHENFATKEALDAHTSRGACRAPWNCDLQWDGVHWSVRPPETEGHRKGVQSDRKG